MGWTPTLTFIGYGKQFQKHRKLLQYLKLKSCAAFYPLLTEEARNLVQNLKVNPEDPGKPILR